MLQTIKPVYGVLILIAGRKRNYSIKQNVFGMMIAQIQNKILPVKRALHFDFCERKVLLVASDGKIIHYTWVDMDKIRNWDNQYCGNDWAAGRD